MAAQLAERFLRWPLPDSVCTDLCATKQGPNRVGTNLLSFIEAKQMMKDVVLPVLAPLVVMCCESTERANKELNVELTAASARLSQAEKERHRMCARVFTGEYSEDCPFCLAKPSTPGVPNPMCHLCDMESERDALLARAELADELAEALNKISDLQTRWPGWGYQDLYEESQEIAGPILAKLAATKGEQT